MKIRVLLAFAFILGLAPVLSLADPTHFYESVHFSIDVPMKEIPSGKDVCLPKGTWVQSQSKDNGLITVLPLMWPAEVRCGGQVLDPAKRYTITQTDWDNAGPRDLGLAAGVMAIPFKYYAGGNHEFAGNASLGGYLGLKFEDKLFGYALTPVVFAGASTINVGTGNGGTQNLTGFSYGIGLIGTVAGSVQLGLVLGQDRVSHSANWVNNGKTWLALQIGYDFLK